MKDEKRSLWWSLYGIMVEEHWDQYDRRRRIYDIYIPKLDSDGQIVSFKHDYCTRYNVCTFADVERILNRTVSRQYKRQLAAAMKESRRNWRDSKNDTQEG